MPETLQPIETFEANYACDECGERVTFDGMAFPTYPVQYPHTCPAGHKVTLRRAYPAVVYRSALATPTGGDAR